MTLETAHSPRSSPVTSMAVAAAAPPSPFSLGWSAAGFWLASLAGFVLHGWILARSAASGWAEPGVAPSAGEAFGAALELGLLEGLVLGAPAALLFAAIMRRSRSRASAALALSGAMSLGLAAVLASWARAALDFGWARLPAVHLAVAIATVAAGSIAGAISGRRSALHGEGSPRPK
jgi:hypothetical protein